MNSNLLVRKIYKTQETSYKVDFLKEQTQCPICSGALNILVENITPHQVKEEARCTQCLALSRVQDHCLH